MRCCAVDSTILDIAISRSLLACRILCGESPVAAAGTWFISGSMLGTRPYRALYGVVELMLSSELPANTASDSICGNGMKIPSDLH